MRYPIVFWDSGGTIFRGEAPEGPAVDPSPRQVRETRSFRAAHVLEMFGHEPPGDLAGVIEQVEADLRGRFGPRYSLEVLAAGLYAALGLGEHPEETVLLSDALGGPRYRTWLWEGVAEALAALHRAGAQMGLIANTEWTGRMMRRALAGVGLDGLFEPVVCSCDVGAAKPDPRIFAAALAGLTPPASPGASVLHVGDSVAADVAGAVKFGWDAAFHQTDPGVSSGRAVLVFTDYGDLIRLVTAGA